VELTLSKFVYLSQLVDISLYVKSGFEMLYERRLLNIGIIMREVQFSKHEYVLCFYRYRLVD